MTPEQKFQESKSVEDYLLIPFSRRCYLGVFYKNPDSLKSGDWCKWTQYIEKKFSVQFFFREYIAGKMRYYWRLVKEAKYYLINRFWRRTHLLDLGNCGQYHDVDFRIEKALEVLFMDFYRNEYLGGFVNWEAEPVLNSKIKEIYNFFTEVRPRLQLEIANLEEELYGFTKSNDLDDVLDFMNNQTPERMAKTTNLFKLEEQLDQQHSKYLQMIVEIRRSLWT